MSVQRLEESPDFFVEAHFFAEVDHYDSRNRTTRPTG